MVIDSDGKAAVRQSAARYLRAIGTAGHFTRGIDKALLKQQDNVAAKSRFVVVSVYASQRTLF